MHPGLFTIWRTGPGRLATMARPRGGDWLADEFEDLALVGVNIVVSMLTDAETAELDLVDEAAAAEAAGIEFGRLPTPDRQVPGRDAALAMAASLRDRLSRGASVAVHCRYGIGRSSTLAAAVLVLEGADPDNAWTRISVARGLPVPDTAAQRDFVRTLAKAPHIWPG
jgi:protein-tyrosine phosphatase